MKSKKLALHIPKICLSLLCCLLISIPLQAQTYDLLIRNARIVDGTGNAWYEGDIATQKGMIVKIGELGSSKAKQIIDAGGLYAAPGFIDVHTHVEKSLPDRPSADNFLYDGVTSIITGNCGGSEENLGKFFNAMEKEGLSINLASLVGHNTVRNAVLGSSNRAPNAEELQQMEALVAQAMEDGAVGLSTGLIYVPGTYAETDEVVALAKVAAQYQGVYASHIRNEANEVFDAIDEAVHIGKEANIPVEISHIKISSKKYWGRTNELLERIEDYRAQGIDVTVDQYPYTASSTRLGVLLPSWAFSGGTDSLRARLADTETRKKIKAEMLETLRSVGFEDYSYSVVANCPWEEKYSGKSIAEINLMLGKTAGAAQEAETIMDMMAKVEEGDRVQMVYHKMDENDVQHLMRYPFTMIARDAGVPEMGKGAPHPRAYGSCSRVLAHYVHELGVISLEDAIRKMTSLPAQRFQLRDRGLLQEGKAADILLFDLEEINSPSTFESPHAYSEGMEYVIVNGKPAVEKGKYNGERPGQLLKGQEAK
ncbi:N-acyl-D-amino-acid deacylase [Catalinimonas alkaloidigena]|uniref:N-acyl-D-amino-acid deacylase family protein n=1 Tax=Catalinimonas alkaloidigena TaxID=1075417 RepID=UPI002406C0FF|nr:D-aminoacylase [Catalinimonas alkaloidigena]MDF9798635.1 N-acyl-D-amino-acid deacylase [Catalinimonas alkaloidigena]